MDPQIMANALIGLLLAVSTGATWLSTNQRKARGRARAQGRDLEEATEYITRARREQHVHNDEQHPTGDGAILVRPLPSYLTRGDDDDV